MTRHKLTIGEFANDVEVDDKSGQLFWKDHPVVVERRLSLQTYQVIIAAVAAIGAFANGAVAVGRAIGWWP